MRGFQSLLRGRILQIPSVKTSKASTVEYLTVRAVQLVVAAAAGDVRDLAIVSLLYNSGARVSEVCGLRIALRFT